MLYTVGYNYYKGYMMPMNISEDVASLAEEESGKCFKIIHIKSGACHFTLNQKEYIMTGAYALCLNEQDQINFLEYQEDSIRILFFEPTLINVLFTINFLHNLNVRISVTDSQDLYFIKQFIYDSDLRFRLVPLRAMASAMIELKMNQLHQQLLKQDNLGWPCRSRSYLFELLFYLIRQEEEEDQEVAIQSVDGCSKLSSDVIYYLQSCYNQKITIEKLAEEFHTNRTTLQTDFKQYTGKSINQYLNQLRLKMASAMLRDTELSIDEICERTGFRDISYFSRVFKNCLKYTPANYRKVNAHVLY